MHCLFLGIAKWITKRIWIDEGVLTEKDLQSIQKKMDEFKVPSDLGQIPGSLPNSHRQIEPELMRQLMTEAQINDIINSSNEMYQFLMNSRNISESPITGCEKFLGKFLALQSKDIYLEEQIYNLLIEYYKNTYVDFIFRKPFMENLPNSTIIINRANRYGKCQICAETFGSAAATRHIKTFIYLPVN
ncbi:hypothetical protein GLOIN_2v1786477 [Rhizophagus irregularis DAOM 181602=DAOM 197198]|nr:hypothetical protein GLOIN_2v1786477 [Rhizophagus irregularis DAOM 181602=DAOM 197198]